MRVGAGFDSVPAEREGAVVPAGDALVAEAEIAGSLVVTERVEREAEQFRQHSGAGGVEAVSTVTAVGGLFR